MDGITVIETVFNLMGSPLKMAPASPPNTTIKHAMMIVQSIARIPKILHSSHVRRTEELTFTELKFSVSETKRRASLNHTSFVPQMTSQYLSAVFSVMPESVAYLRVNITVHIDNPNRFNNFSIVPIGIYRNRCGAVEIKRQINYFKCIVFGFRALIENKTAINVAKRIPYMDPDISEQIPYLNPDINLSLFRTQDDPGIIKGRKINVYSFSSKAAIYSCGVQCGNDSYTITNSCKYLLGGKLGSTI